MSIIEIVAFIVINTAGSLLPQLTYYRIYGRFQLPFSLFWVVVLNIAFLSLYIWVMQSNEIARMIIWGLSILGTSVCAYKHWLICKLSNRKPRTPFV